MTFPMNLTRPKPFGIRLRAGRRFSSFSGPRLGSRPKFLGAALEPCLGLSAGIGSSSAQIVPQKRSTKLKTLFQKKKKKKKKLS
jgi:hypothetical protein